MRSRYFLAVLAVLLFFTPLMLADIVAIDGSQTNPANCGSGPSGVVCFGGTTPFLLSQVLNGSTPLVIGANDTPTFLVKDDLPGTLSSLTLFFTGALASNANIQCQVSGWSATQVPFDQNTCTVNGQLGTGPNGVVPETIVWTQGSGNFGLTNGELFDVRTASFAHSGADHGQLTGVVPEPRALVMIVPFMICIAGFVHRRFHTMLRASRS